MELKKYLSILCMGIIFYACGENKAGEQIANIDLSDCSVIEGQLLDSIDGGVFYDVISLGNNLLLLDRENEYLFHAYSKIDYRKLSQFGKIGPGPADYQFPFLASPQWDNDSSFAVYDVVLCRLDYYSSKLTEKRAPQPYSSVSLPREQLIGYIDPYRSGDCLYLTNPNLGDEAILQYNLVSGNLGQVDLPAFMFGKYDDDPIKRAKLRLSFSGNPQNGFLAVGMKHFNKILFFDQEGRYRNGYRMGSETDVTPVLNSSHEIARESYVFCTKVVSSINHFWVICHNGPLGEYENGMSNQSSKLLLFDRKGNYLTTFQSDRILYTVAFDELTGDLYGIELANEFGSRLFKYPSILSNNQ